MRAVFQAAVFAVLVGVAIVYFAVPARAEAQVSCGKWATDIEDRGPAPMSAPPTASRDRVQR